MTVLVRSLSPSGTAEPGNRAIVVFPHAGGSARFFIPWRRHLPAEVDLYGVTYPGRDTLLDEATPETLVDLAAECATELKSAIGSSESVVLFGHSMGAYVAFEATRALERSGITLRALVASGVEAPHFELQRHAERAWHRACDDDLVRHIGEMDVRSAEVLAVPELRQMFLPTLRDDYRLVENYRSELNPQVACPIHSVYGESDPEVSASGAAAWAAYTHVDCHVRSLQGDHFYLADQPARLVRYLCGILGLS